MSIPKFDILKAVRSARETSEMVKAMAKAKSAFALLTASPARRRKAGYKPLTPAQIQQLSKLGNTAQDWKQVWVGAGFDPKRVSRCHFAGPALLSAFAGNLKVEGVSFPTGLSHATIAACVIGRNAFVRNVRLLNQTVVGEEALVFDVGALTIAGSDSFANGLEVLIAVETGGRETRLFADLTVEGAWVIGRSRANRELQTSYGKEVDAYVKEVTAPCNVIGPSAQILHTPKVSGVFLGAGAVIDSAASVSHVTVLSSTKESSHICDGAIVKSSILQWGCEVTSEAIVDSSLLTEHSHVERHGKVTHSILGPNTGVAEGEVTSALLGPFVGFHHQALLIAALWPEGKGNVGYGANIGSNHTAKAPDQEIWPGEGTFFGLGVNIKFPSDLTRSPYSIIASGVSMLPQRVEFPFSLINTQAATYPGISPAYNEIMPAWVLSDNIYMVKRNEGKYQKRNKAKRSKFVFEVFRPEIVDLMLDARRRLQVSAPKEFYTAKEIEGLGKNYMLEANRKKAVETYTFTIRYYALLGLKREMETLAGSRRLNGGRAPGGVSGAASASRSHAPGRVSGDASASVSQNLDDLLKAKSSNPRWEHERQILSQEFPGAGIKQMLETLVSSQEKIAAQVQSSKEKDDRRGAEVIEDYQQAHKPAAQDSFVQETWAITERLKKEVQALLSGSQQSPKSPVQRH